MTTEHYMRTLDQDELQQVWNQVQNRWDDMQNGWYPMTGQDMPADVIALEAPWFYHEISQHTLVNMLKSHGVTRIWELREGHTSGYEMDCEEIYPYYDGEEGYWTSESMDWLIYASHEHSLTVAGEWLITAVKGAWPGWQEHIYTTYKFDLPPQN